jgi:magnesium chelatase family protein
VARYRKKISGPLLDRIDMKVAVDPVDLEAKFAPGAAEASSAIRERVAAARERQTHRYAGTPVPCNAFIPGGEVSRWCVFDEAGFEAYRAAVARLNLSTRATDKLAKLSRTFADLAGAEKTGPSQVEEATQLLGTDLLG